VHLGATIKKSWLWAKNSRFILQREATRFKLPRECGVPVAVYECAPLKAARGLPQSKTLARD